MKKLMKKQKGITLIALVVTIIVLLILAGISIMMLTGQSGILNQARAAKEDTRGGEVKDEVALAVSENTMADYTGNGTRKSRQEVIDQLHKEGKLTDDEVTWLEEHDQITIGSIEIDFSSLGETTEEKLEDMYFLYGNYNDGKIENIRLSFLPRIKQKIVKKYLDKFMTEEELVLKFAVEEGLTEADTFEDFMKEIYNDRIHKQYTTAKEFATGYRGISSEEYDSYIQYLREQYDNEGNMSEEELLLQDAVEYNETTAATFEQWMKEIYNKKQCTTAKEFIMEYMGCPSDEEYNLYIQRLREEYEGEKGITIEDSMGNQMNYYWDETTIEGQGKYEFTIKIDGEEVGKFSVNIDKYEIIYAHSSIAAYDFTNEKILKIDSGEYTYYSDDGKEITIQIPNEDITTIEGIGSFIESFAKTDRNEAKYKLKSSNIITEGYFYSTK